MKRFGYLYFAVGIFALYLPTSGEGEFWKLVATKPLIGLSLLYYVFRTLPDRSGFSYKLLIIGILCTWLGDIFLMFPGTFFFIAGLLSFLAAHGFYSSLFYRLGSNIGWEGGAWGINVTVLGYFMIFIYSSAPHFGTMLGPLIIYAVVLSLMVLFAYGTLNKVPFEASMLIFMGAFFFIISDSILAWNKFVNPINNSHWMILGSYMVAQYGIVVGLVRALSPEGADT